VHWGYDSWEPWPEHDIVMKVETWYYRSKRLNFNFITSHNLIVAQMVPNTGDDCDEVWVTLADFCGERESHCKTVARP